MARLFSFVSLGAACALAAMAAPNDAGAGAPLLDQSKPPTPEEVAAALETAAADLEASNAKVTDLEAKLATETARADTAEKALAKAKSGAKGDPAAAAAEAPKGKDVARVTVLLGSVSHPRAEGGEAVKDQSFPVTEAEADELSSLADRGIVSIAAL